MATQFKIQVSQPDAQVAQVVCYVHKNRAKKRTASLRTVPVAGKTENRPQGGPWAGGLTFTFPAAVLQPIKSGDRFLVEVIQFKDDQSVAASRTLRRKRK